VRSVLLNYAVAFEESERRRWMKEIGVYSDGRKLLIRENRRNQKYTSPSSTLLTKNATHTHTHTHTHIYIYIYIYISLVSKLALQERRQLMLGLKPQTELISLRNNNFSCVLVNIGSQCWKLFDSELLILKGSCGISSERNFGQWSVKWDGKTFRMEWGVHIVNCHSSHV